MSTLAARPPPARIGGPAWAWASCEAGRIPYVALISASVFVPYFATQVVGDPVKGQGYVALLGTISGLVAGFTSPLLGASLDAVGPRKPWLAAGSALLAAVLVGLWWARPHGLGLSIAAVIAMLAVVKVLYSYTEVLHNSLLPIQTEARSVHRVSALGMGIGSVAGVLVLTTVLFAFTLPGRVRWPMVPARPLFGLDVAAFENARIAGPIAGVLILAAVVPLLLFARDYPRAKVGAGQAVREGARYLIRLPGRLRGNRDAATFLFFRMIYADGATSLVLFGGVYAAGVMHWGGVQLLTIGVFRMASGALGAAFAGWLDGVLGCKRAVQLELTGMTLLVLAMIGTRSDHMLFFWRYAGPPPSKTGIFSTPPEWLMLGIIVAIAFLSLALASSSRSFLSRISPPAETGAYFGLYALAGSATAWLAPTFIGLCTTAFHSQQAGIVPILFFLVAGGCGLFLVKATGDAGREGLTA